MLPVPPFATQLNLLRRAAGLSQGELARRARCTRPYISQLESGRRRAPSRAFVLRLATALELQGNEREGLLAASGWPELEVPLRPVHQPTQTLAAQLVGGLPYPAAIHDSCWVVSHDNEALRGLMQAVGAPLLSSTSFLEAVFHPALRARLPDWEAWARAMLAQFKRDSAHLGHPAPQRALLARLHTLADFTRLWKHVEAAADTTPSMSVVFSLPGLKTLPLEVLRFQVVGLPELWLVAFLPVGEDAAQLLRELCAAAEPGAG